MSVQKIKTLLKDEIETELNTMGDIEFGGEQHKLAVDSVGKLLDKLNDMEKMELEYQDKAAARDMEHELELKKMDDERKDRIVKNGLTLTSVVTGIGLTVWGTLKSIEFEKEGTITTIMGRGFIQKLLPKK